MICVVATVTLMDGKRENYLEEIRKILPIVRMEKGCIEYNPTVDVDTGSNFQIKNRPDTVIILEKWDNLEALKAHGLSPHMTDFRSAVKEFVQSMQLQILAPA
ncbi:MAG: antibiotic biosynthesis monooxygenase [Deltaproteobacteria bacterium]